MKIVLTSGVNTYTYGVDTANWLQRVTHREQPYSQTAQALVENSDNTLTSLNLEGYQAVISYGFETSAGNQYSASAPLKVKAQELLNISGRLVCQFDLFGIPDQLAGDKALSPYTQDSDDTNTVKDLFDAIAGATLAPYTHTTAITVNWDSEDSLIDSFQPKDSFHISVGESRLDKLKELLSYTKCVMRIESDGQIHIFTPTITGTTYDYEYNDDFASTSHPFFSKIYRTRLVLPNKYLVKSHPAATPQYTGSATSAASFALLPQTEPVLLRLTSNAQAAAIAAAKIQRAELEHEKGSLFAPMNVGQEAWDYIKVTDAVEGDNRIGNIGYLTRNYSFGNFDFQFGFGDILLGASIGLGGILGEAGEPGEPGEAGRSIFENLLVMSQNINILSSELATVRRLQDLIINKQNVIASNQTLLWNREVVPKWKVTNQMVIPSPNYIRE